MKNMFMIAAVAALMAGTAFTDSAVARDRGDRAGRAAPTANQIVAEADARTARFKADLQLTPEQEKNWPGLESALHAIAQSRADRLIALRAEREQQKEPGDVIEYLSSDAKFLGERSTEEKKIADAAQPLYASLDDQQKRRFARELIILSREGDRD
jgi:hypothetical protein